MSKKYLVISLLKEIVKNVSDKSAEPKFDSGYRLFIQTDVVTNYVDIGVITRQSPTLVRSWFDDVFCEQPCRITPPIGDVISRCINECGRSRARNHVLLIGRELAEYATEEMPCIVFDDGPFFFAENCYTFPGWQELARKIQSPVIAEAMEKGKNVAEIIGNGLDDAIEKNF